MDILLAEAEIDPEKHETLPTEARMHLGMAHFYVADYAGARAAFETVLGAEPENARALYGRLLCSMCTADWKRAGQDLDRLARQGEIRPGDRLDAEGCFGDPKVVDAFVEGLRGHARYKISDGASWLLTAWALAATGDEAKARTCLRLARRWNASGAALPVLEKNLGMAKAPKAQPASKETPEPAAPAAGGVIARR
jgi:hypothetical protein